MAVKQRETYRHGNVLNKTGTTCGEPEWIAPCASNREAEIARCDREIAAMKAQDDNCPAWLSTLGITDWEVEKMLIEREAK